jgi:hypothetical protein
MGLLVKNGNQLLNRTKHTEITWPKQEESIEEF